MSALTQQDYPSLAEIVRQETDGGRLIVQFYLGVAYGDIEGFRDHHRAAAARRIDKIAPGLVKEYLLQFHNEQVRESMRGSLFPMGSREPAEKESPVRRGPNAFQRRLNKLIREDTIDGRSIVDFLVGVMEGYITGFRPHHRLEAADQLATHITNPSPDPRDPAPEQSGVPAQAGTQRGGAGRSLFPPRGKTQKGALPPPSTEQHQDKGATPIVVPAQAGTQRGGAEWGSSSSPSPSTGEGWGEGDRGGAGRGSHSPSQSSESTNPENPDSDNPRSLPALDPSISRKELARNNFQPHHLDTYHFARDEITGAIYAFDHIGPIVIDDDGEIHRIDPDRIAGYHKAAQNARRSSPSPLTGEGRGEGDSPAVAAKPETQTDADPIVVPADAGFLPEEPSPTQKPGDPIVVPAQAGTHPRRGRGAGQGSSSPSTEDDQGEGDSPAVAAKPEFLPQEPSPTQKPGDTIVVPARAGTQRGGERRGSSPSQSSQSPNQANHSSDNPRPQPGTRVPRKLRRRMGNARARMRREQARHRPAHTQRPVKEKPP